MENAFQAPLTPEQLAAVTAGGGYARCEDPKTHVVYHLFEQPEPATIDDDYVRKKIEEAYADVSQNGFQPLDLAAVKAELQRRLSAAKGARRGDPMPRIERSRLAEEDLLTIAEYIARDNPPAAVRWLDAMEAKLSLLAQQPLMGEVVDHIRLGLRRSQHGKYLIFYEPRDFGIAVVRILHGARKIEELL